MDYSEYEIKFNRKIDNLAEARGMTRQEFEDWSKRETFKTEINNQELLTMKAYQIEQAILRIESTEYPKGQALRKEYWWVERFRENFDRIDKLFKHLTDVCAYTRKKYDRDYVYEWLLTYDDDFYFWIKDKKGSSKLKYKNHREAT